MAIRELSVKYWVFNVLSIQPPAARTPPLSDLGMSLRVSGELGLLTSANVCHFHVFEEGESSFSDNLCETSPTAISGFVKITNRTPRIFQVSSRHFSTLPWRPALAHTPAVKVHFPLSEVKALFTVRGQLFLYRDAAAAITAAVDTATVIAAEAASTAAVDGGGKMN